MTIFYNYCNERKQIVDNEISLIANKYKIPKPIENIISSFTGYENKIMNELEHLKNNFRNLIKYHVENGFISVFFYIHEKSFKVKLVSIEEYPNYKILLDNYINSITIDYNEYGLIINKNDELYLKINYPDKTNLYQFYTETAYKRKRNISKWCSTDICDYLRCDLMSIMNKNKFWTIDEWYDIIKRSDDFEIKFFKNIYIDFVKNGINYTDEYVNDEYGVIPKKFNLYITDNFNLIDFDNLTFEEYFTYFNYIEYFQGGVFKF